VKHEETSRTGSLARLLAGLVSLFVFGALLLLPLGGSSTSSEIELAPYLPRSAHQAYAYSLAHRLNEDPGRSWLLAAERAAAQAQEATLPFEAAGTFDPEEVKAPSFRFSARGGQRVYIQVVTAVAAQDDPSKVFVDLYRADAGRFEYERSTAPQPTGPPLSATQSIELAVLEPADYLVRVQPEIGHSGSYAVRIETAPLLSFPVHGVDRRAIQSGFGAERDAGARSHRGVDIFAARGTPALAAMDSWVMRVDTTPRGGNVVWLQPLFSDMRLYYAHLDSFSVAAGELVLAGDVIGTVGNTGNARTTPPHLHFGVYVRKRGMRGGARDPYPFLD
jgi:peptidoglycan LD-endopeptidase LytH